MGSSLDLEEVLGAVVQLLTDACSVHACFVYLVDDDRLVLEAASDPYAHLVGTIALDTGAGLAWWAAEHKEPAWIGRAARHPHVKTPRAQGAFSRSSPCRSSQDSGGIGHLEPHRAPRE